MFAKFNFDLTTLFGEFKSAVENGSKKLKELKESKTHTYDSFIAELDMCDDKLDLLFTQLSHINSVYNSKKNNKIYLEASNILTDYSNEFFQSKEVFTIIKSIKKDSKNLSKEQSKVLDDYLLSFTLSGIDLNSSDKERLNTIKKRLNELSITYSTNVLYDTNKYKLTVKKSRLKGVKPSIVEPYKSGKDEYTFTLQIPSYITVMTYIKDREIRKEIYLAYLNRGKKNTFIVDEILKLRKEKAKLLGFNSHAEYSLATKMASTTKEVLNFLTDLAKNSKLQAKKELKKLENEAKSDNIFQLLPYDTTYYANIVKEKEYSIDEEKYREYFELHSTLNSVLNFLAELFDVEIVESKPLDKNSKSFYVIENEQIISKLYLDLEVRKNKNSGAWMHNYETRYKDKNGNIHPSSAFLVCNFPKESAKHKSLLRVGDVTTLFHELGHTFHHLLSKVNEKGVSGINSFEWDAIEFPSQFLENFAYEKDVLKRISSHYKTKKPLSNKMIDDLIKSKNFNSAMFMLKQLEYSLFDFKLHLSEIRDAKDVLKEVQNEVSITEQIDGVNFQNSFSHIFAGGYSAGYYSYKWAEVLSADAYMYVKEIGRKEGMSRYKKEVLNIGSSKKAKDIYLSFKDGKEIDPLNLLRLNGIDI